MLGDAYSSFGETASSDTRHKVWTHADMVFGTAGHIRSILVFRYGFKFPPMQDDQDEDAYMRYTVPKALREHLREQVHVVTENGGEDFNLGILIGWRGRLWRISEDLAVTEAVRGYSAIGSGMEIALGSLCTTETLTDTLTPQERLELAAQATAEHIDTVRAPFTLVELAAPSGAPGTCLGGLQYSPGAQPLEPVRLTAGGPPVARTGDLLALHVDAPGGVRSQFACTTCQHWTVCHPVPGQEARIGACAILHATARELRAGVPLPERERLITPAHFGCMHHEPLK